MNPKLTAYAGDDKVKIDAPVQIGGEASGGTPPYQYSWQPSSGLDNPTEPNPNADPDTTTTYTVTVTDSKGCKATDEVKVTVQSSDPDFSLSSPKPIIELEPDKLETGADIIYIIIVSMPKL